MRTTSQISELTALYLYCATGYSHAIVTAVTAQYTVVGISGGFRGGDGGDASPPPA